MVRLAIKDLKNAVRTLLANREIVFIHIPKTAGTSLTEYLGTALRDRREKLSEEGSEVELLCGHHYLSEVWHESDQRYFITILRDPISRMVSQYRSFHNHDNYPPNWRSQLSAEQVAALEFCRVASFDEVLFSPAPSVIGKFFNVQARMLSDYKLSIRELLVSEALQDRVLSSAMVNLVNKIDFFGIFEMMGISLILLKEETGLCGDLRHRNLSEKYEAKITPREIAKLRELLALDLRLYEFGLHLFKSRVAARGLIVDEIANDRHGYSLRSPSHR
jgi:hypothetical protein